MGIMKRLVLFLLIVMLLKFGLCRHQPRARAGDDSTPATRLTPVIALDGEPCQDDLCPLRANAPMHRHPATVVPVDGPPALPLPPGPPAPPDSTTPATLAPEPPNWFQRDTVEVKPIRDVRSIVPIKGAPSATEERAWRNARAKLEQKVAEWLQPEVPYAWPPPHRLIDAMIVDQYLQPEPREYSGETYTLYRAGYRADFSQPHRAEIIEAYQRSVVAQRLAWLGGGIGFILVCLAAIAGYIRADEATKGYYTNRLRLVAAAAVGAAGMAIYQMLT
jgi:hypothetical protein